MRLTPATVLALAYATAVLASPMKRLQVRQNGDDDDDDDGPGNTGNSTGPSNVSDNDSDDAVLFSPANLTTVAAGSTFNFTYLCDDDDCSSVRVALIQYLEVRNPEWALSSVYANRWRSADCHRIALHAWQRRKSCDRPAYYPCERDGRPIR